MDPGRRLVSQQLEDLRRAGVMIGDTCGAVARMKGCVHKRCLRSISTEVTACLLEELLGQSILTSG